MSGYKIIKEVSAEKLIKYFFYKLALIIYFLLYFSPFQILFLRIMGAKIGKNVIIENLKVYNLYTGGFGNLSVGNNVYIGDDCLFDLANKIKIGDNVTFAARCVISTHLNVGYSDHSLKKNFPRYDADVEIESNVFVGINSTILAGVKISRDCFIGACTLVNKSTEPCSAYAGAPARKIRSLNGEL